MDQITPKHAKELIEFLDALVDAVTPEVRAELDAPSEALILLRGMVPRQQTAERIQRQRVAHSGNIAEIGYDEDSKTLEVQFQNGGTYRYDGVPADVAAGLVDSPSKGKYLHQHIKGTYAYQRVTE